MSLTNPYCSVAQVQEELRNTEPELVGVIEDAINQASRFIDEYKGRDYFEHDHTTVAAVVREFDHAVADHFLYLPYWPVIELEEVTVNSEAWTVDTDFLVDNERLVSLRGNWPVLCVSDKVELVGRFGYAQETDEDVPTGIPSEVTRAAILLAAAFTGHNSKEVVGVDGSKSQVIDKAISKTVFTLLGSRRLII